jgi:hypothetical protein
LSKATFIVSQRKPTRISRIRKEKWKPRRVDYAFSEKR